MGKVIARTASIRRILEAVMKTLAAAQAHGGEVKRLAEARVAPSLTALNENEQALAAAHAADEVLHAALLARDGESDLEIGAVCDEIWNALGRPSRSVDFEMIVNGGKRDWCDGDPALQPELMATLAKNIRGSEHPRLSDKKEAWAARIEQKAAAQALAAKPAVESYARVTALTTQRRTLADAAQVSLVRFKRDLLNLGMTEAQVHEIIPDTPSSTGAASTQPSPKPAPTPAA